MKKLICIVLLAVAPAVVSGQAQAKSAQCFTSDDGNYDCQFEAMGKDGSFQISAEGYPTFQLEMDQPGFAFGNAKYDPNGNFVALPGQYVRQSDDGACWANPETDSKICAW
jgi:hypothetical protein